MDNKNLVVSIVIGIIAVVASVFLGGTTVVKEITKDTSNVNTGAISSPDISSPYVSWGGVRHWGNRTVLNGDAASTTICVIQSPAASSSLTHFAVRLNTGTTTSMALKAYKSVSRYLTTTQLTDTVTLPSMTEVTAYATTSAALNTAFTGGDWLVVTATVAAGGNGVSSPTGQCQAEWNTI